MDGLEPNQQKPTIKYNVPNPFAQSCEVCGATGVEDRYGVIACVSCKSWFRRHRQVGKTKMVCEVNGNCDMRMFGPFRCQACRWKKSLEAGFDAWPTASKRNFSAKKGAPTVTKVNYDFPTDARMVAWQNYSKILEKSIESIGIFIRNLNNNLSLTDNYHLFMNKAFPLHCLQISRVLSSKGLYLPSGQLMSVPELVLLYGDFLLFEMTDVSEKIQKLKFTDEDIEMLMTLVYYYSTIGLNLEDEDRLEELYKEHKDKFSQCMEPQKFAEMDDLVGRYCLLHFLHKKEVTSYLNMNQEHFDDDTLFKELYVGVLNDKPEGLDSN